MPLTFRHLTLSSEVLSQTVGDEAVLLDMKTESYFSLNAVGVRVWELLGENGDVEAARNQILAEFDVTEAQLDQDLNDLLSRMLEAGLVNESTDAPA